MSKDYTQILFPVGRFVAGAIAQGRQVEKNDVKQVDPTTGQPILEWSFGCAIPKTPGKDWKDEPWGAQMVAVAQRDWPQGQWQHPQFSWKLTDGDSTIPNKKGNVPNTREGYPGHWVVFFSSRYACKTVNATGSQPVPAEGIKPGHYIQVLASVAGNGGQSPGIYMNHDFVAHAAYGPEISISQQDASTVGFGQGALPPGATTAPVGAMTLPPVTVATPVQVPTVPNAAALVPPVVPTAPRYVLTDKAKQAGATTVEALLASPGWSEDIAKQHGYIVAV